MIHKKKANQKRIKYLIALGSNIGNREHNLNYALKLLRGLLIEVKSSSIYESPALLKPNSPEAWNISYLNMVIVGYSNLKPQNMLNQLKKIEALLGRVDQKKSWAPRIIDLDILLAGTLILSEKHCSIPHPEFLKRDFCLIPAAEIEGAWIHPLSQNSLAEQARKLQDISCEKFRKQNNYNLSLDNSNRLKVMTKILGILNFTPNSFSDGGNFFAVDKALKYVRKLFLDGANIIDIGAVATSYGARSVEHEEEWQRLQPLLSQCASDKISIDTYCPETAKKAIELGVGFINDVSGGRDEKMLEAIAASSNVKYICVYSLVLPADRETTARSMDEILEWGAKKIDQIQSFGIDKDRFIFDPGIGFATNAELSFEVIRRVAEFKQLGVPLCIGHSRKFFFNTICHVSPEEKDIETLSASIYLLTQKVDYIRVHNVEWHVRAFRSFQKFWQG